MVTRYCRKVATTENLTFGASMTKNIFLTFSIFQKGIKKKKKILIRFRFTNYYNIIISAIFSEKNN